MGRLTPLQRWLRDLIDWLCRRYYEGPEPPPRLTQEVRLFAATHRDATVDEWKEFATRLAQNAYRDGFARGDLWAYRLWPGPETDPELLLELALHQRTLPEERIHQLEQQPSPVLGMSAAEAAHLQHQLHRAGARIVIIEGPGGSPPARPTYPKRRV